MKEPDRYIVIDDDAINNVLSEAMLQRVFVNADIKVFMSPEKALEFIEEEYVKSGSKISTVLFLDINMPTMTGWDFLNKFKNCLATGPPFFNIFMFTSSSDDHDIEQANTNPCVSGFVSKPLNKKTLREMFPAE